MKLNPGIVKTVKLLTDAGYKTCDSGDGETHDFPCDRELGYVVVRLTASQGLVHCCHRISSILKKHGITLTDNPEETGGTQVNGSYDPYNGISLVDVYNISDKMKIALAGSYQVRRYRLDSRNDHANRVSGSGRGSSKGVGQETSFPIFARFSYKPTTMSGIDLFAGFATGGNVRVEDKAGHKLKDDDYKTAGILGAKFTYMF